MSRSDSTGRWLGVPRLVALLLIVISSGCAPDPGSSLWVDPGTIRVTPDHRRATIAIHNRTPLARPVRDVRLSGADWDAMRFVDEDLPSSIAAGEVVTLTLEVSPSAFRQTDGQLREGHALLEFESEWEQHAIPIAFVPRPGPSGSIGWTLVLGALLWLTAGGLTRLRDRAPAAIRDRGRSVGLALAFVGAFATAAMLPIGRGWCAERSEELVGAFELARCRVGLGGGAMAGWDPDPSWAWLLVALTASTIGVAIAGGRLRAAQMMVRLVGFGLIWIAVVASLGSADLVQPNDQITLGALNLPRWGVFVQPLALPLIAVLIADVDARTPERGLIGFARVDDLAWSGLIVVLFLGAGSLPGLHPNGIPRLAHGPELAVTAVAFVVKLAIVWVVVRWLRQLRQQSNPHRRPAPQTRARVVLLLAALNCLVTIGWHAVDRIGAVADAEE